MFVDSHCHLHESEFYVDDREDVYSRAIAADVKMICIGTSEKFSAQAVEFVKTHDNTWATVGVHPHDSKDGWERIGELLGEEMTPRSTRAPRELQGVERTLEFTSKVQVEGLAPPKTIIVGIGEIGLDYYYDNSPREVQIQAFEQQLQWAKDYQLPVSFHVRDGRHGEVWQDFWPILANFPDIKGVLHSFTDTVETLEKALSRGFFIGVNGISTFAKDKQAMWDRIPLEKILLETDAPFLTPAPFRGNVNEPAFVAYVAKYHAQRRGVDLNELAKVTTANATALFHLT